MKGQPGCRTKSKAKADTYELAPEIPQVIALVAEILLEQRRRQLEAARSGNEAA